MTEEVQPTGDQGQKYYKVELFGSSQSEKEYNEERARFSALLKVECDISPVEGIEIYDTRKTLMALAVKYAGGKAVPHDEYVTILSLGKKMLQHENKEGFIPFVVRNRKKHEFSAIMQYPHSYLTELVLQRFIDTEEMARHEEPVLGEGVAGDAQAALDFCLDVHAWNTEYYRRFPSVGVLFSEEVAEAKRFRVGEQANYLVWWRGLPYEISQLLIEFKVLDSLDDSRRDEYLGKLFAMGLEELFDESYFGYETKPPAIPRYLEFPPRLLYGEGILSMLGSQYTDNLVVQATQKKALANEYQQYSQKQLAWLQRIFSGPEEVDLV